MNYNQRWVSFNHQPGFHPSSAKITNSKSVFKCRSTVLNKQYRSSRPHSLLRMQNSRNKDSFLFTQSKFHNRGNSCESKSNKRRPFLQVNLALWPLFSKSISFQQTDLGHYLEMPILGSGIVCETLQMTNQLTGQVLYMRQRLSEMIRGGWQRDKLQQWKRNHSDCGHTALERRVLQDFVSWKTTEKWPLGNRRDEF